MSATDDREPEQQDDLRIELSNLLKKEFLTFSLIPQIRKREELAELLVAPLKTDEPVRHEAGFNRYVCITQQPTQVSPRGFVILSTSRVEFVAVVLAAEVVPNRDDARPRRIGGRVLKAETLGEKCSAG
ncbi:MAG TPA: hypothetical protein VGR47_21690 [Terracidiphilus sp.]|nr:hypothetical protein [Terracidiphilus sp.]